MRDVACKETAGKIDPVSAMTNLACACIDHDVKRALVAWPHVTMDRESLREMCEAAGVKLPK